MKCWHLISFWNVTEYNVLKWQTYKHTLSNATICKDLPTICKDSLSLQQLLCLLEKEQQATTEISVILWYHKNDYDDYLAYGTYENYSYNAKIILIININFIGNVTIIK